jgi:anti-sigma B factor antagonist
MRLRVLAPEGELDVAAVGEFRSSVADATRERSDVLLVDLSGVSFIDSSGLGALVEANERLAREGRRLAVVAPPGSAAAVLLNLTGLGRGLPVYETWQDAAGA